MSPYSSNFKSDNYLYMANRIKNKLSNNKISLRKYFERLFSVDVLHRHGWMLRFISISCDPHLYWNA